MAQPSTIPQELMSGTLLHFESGVPIKDLNIKPSQRKRLARVQHVYWIWMNNPFLDTQAMFKQLCKQEGYADRTAEWHAAQKDQMLLDFVIEHVQNNSRRKDEAKVRAAAEQAIRIGMETDNAVALTKGGKLLYEVAGLAQPESEQADMSKATFLQPVVTTKASEVDETKIDYNDEQGLQIMKEFGAYIDPKRELVDEKVALIEAKKHEQTGNDEHK